ncbi:hypothetical protein PISMIDRAFT_435893 [Pisolithus microcarpus 441]|uniref:Uncharacterized protein n=1 Tax=Pisolithus microcarpus 441 TaxID=765257 RepID=A0A0C9ZCP7_9AGAM|nr:hypothetical protein PISMIDRAFT_435893 [Pisolithus microcarpus 441]
MVCTPLIHTSTQPVLLWITFRYMGWPAGNHGVPRSSYYEGFRNHYYERSGIWPQMVTPTVSLDGLEGWASVKV